MRLADDTLISYEKLTRYLLTLRKRNDKSLWLARAGYTRENWQALENDLRNLILSNDARPIEDTKYGQMYEIRADLIGPIGKRLPVCTTWMREASTGITKFITMYPDKRR